MLHLIFLRAYRIYLNNSRTTCDLYSNVIGQNVTTMAQSLLSCSSTQTSKQQPTYSYSLSPEECTALNVYLSNQGLPHFFPEQTVSIGYRFKEYCSARYKRIKARNSFTVRFRCFRSVWADSVLSVCL